MKLNENPIMLLLGIILVGVGIGSFLGYRFFPDTQNLIILVFVLAFLLIILTLSGRVKESVGVIIAALWLVLMGLMAYFNLKYSYSELLLSALPLAGGVFMVMGM